jgi:CBS domain-containing protein
VASAGPAVNVVIAALLYLLIKVSGMETSFAETMNMNINAQNFALVLMQINIALVVFNLIPAFPMDGGRIFRALLSLRMTRLKATKIAAFLGQAIAVLFVIGGLYSNPILAIIGIFVFLGAQYESRITQATAVLQGYVVKDVMMNKLPLVKPSDTLGAAVQKLMSGQGSEFIATDNGHVEGIITCKEILEGLSQKGKDIPIKEIMSKDFIELKSDQPVSEAYKAMQMNNHALAPVVDSSGKLIGSLDLNNIAEFIMVHSAMERHAA